MENRKHCLVLSRYDGEAIWIGEDVRITLYRKGRYRECTRVIIEAPLEINIVREEIKNRPATTKEKK